MMWPLQESKCLKKWPALECRIVITIKITIAIYIAPKSKTSETVRHKSEKNSLQKQASSKYMHKKLSKREI